MKLGEEQNLHQPPHAHPGPRCQIVFPMIFVHSDAKQNINDTHFGSLGGFAVYNQW